MSKTNLFEDKVAWITGASSGIGEALAKQLAKSGAKVIISSFDEKELKRVQSEVKETRHPIEFLEFDLSIPEDVQKAAFEVLKKFGRVDFLFNNGGVSQRTMTIDTSIELDRKIMETNYFSGVILSKALLPSMIENGSGHIIATSSISGLFGFPLRSAYAASKHALHGFYESVWTELSRKGIKTTIVCPGRVKTNISMHALDRDGNAHGKMDAGQASGISTEKAAKEILHAVQKNRRTVLVGGKELLMVHIKRFFPGLFYYLVTRIKPT